ncbi:hypothetical protein [Aeromicrobium ginsengisoli]|uniref:Uncharacterized protein n=1 Tax=Aeromicrobium ginsengisoli TaxID=363867 RepID=A0A5M4FJX9_9ACTN|nr:hypothetical protein [Aeromicrobium ginsengisoli]KAA1400361.1 hypothetical protein ESP70_006435 [Aeromicrobium ginsengisoli]
MTETAPPPTSRRRRIVQAAVALLVVAGVTVAYWQVSARQAMADVRVVPASLVCNDKPTPYGLQADSGEAPRPAFRFSIAPDDKCLLTVAVVNHGSRTIHVDSMTFPMLKPGGDSGVVIDVTTRAADGIRARTGGSDSMDAVFDLGESIEPDESFDWTFVVRYRVPSSTCDAGTSIFSDLPHTRVSRTGVSADVDGDVNLLIKTTPPPAGVPNDCG